MEILLFMVNSYIYLELSFLISILIFVICM
jgi:hypothetical protein